MPNLLLLFNPYYQSDVIEQHLKLLIQNEQVAFGKVKSKLKTDENALEVELENIYGSVDESSYLQLFLTDYSSCFVAKVTMVTDEDLSNIAPNYYREKNLEVEKWFLISDIREIVRDDFKSIRDSVLANLTTPAFANHTYAIYGNSYTYPLIIDMKQEIDYFDGDDKSRFYLDMFKSEKFLTVKNNIIKYAFGSKYISYLHPDSIDNIVSAEMEYDENISNPIYDFSTVVIKYAKTIEQEIYIFAKMLFGFLIDKNPKLTDISYSVQGNSYTLRDIFTHKPNIGTYKFILKNESITQSIDSFCEYNFKIYVSKTVIHNINFLQDIRNETVHGKQPSIEDVEKLRSKIIGIADTSIVMDLTMMRVKHLSQKKVNA